MRKLDCAVVGLEGRDVDRVCQCMLAAATDPRMIGTVQAILKQAHSRR